MKSRVHLLFCLGLFLWSSLVLASSSDTPLAPWDEELSDLKRLAAAQDAQGLEQAVEKWQQLQKDVANHRFELISPFWSYLSDEHVRVKLALLEEQASSLALAVEQRYWDISGEVDRHEQATYRELRKRFPYPGPVWFANLRAQGIYIARHSSLQESRHRVYENLIEFALIHFELSDAEYKNAEPTRSTKFRLDQLETALATFSLLAREGGQTAEGRRKLLAYTQNLVQRAKDRGYSPDAFTTLMDAVEKHRTSILSSASSQKEVKAFAAFMKANRSYNQDQMGDPHDNRLAELRRSAASTAPTPQGTPQAAAPGLSERQKAMLGSWRQSKPRVDEMNRQRAMAGSWRAGATS